MRPWRAGRKRVNMRQRKGSEGGMVIFVRNECVEKNALRYTAELPEGRKPQAVPLIGGKKT